MSKTRLGQLFFAVSCLLTSCVNGFSEDEGEKLDKKPFRFTANIMPHQKTRVVGSVFEQNDSVGVFAFLSSTDLTQERLVDNMSFKYSSVNKEFAGSREVYFPEGDALVDIMSYYPYQKMGLEKGKTAMSVGVDNHQEINANFMASDFLVAHKEAVKSVNKLELMYDHKFSKLKINLKLPEGIDETALKDKKPNITVDGFYTKAFYDFKTNKIEGWSDIQSVYPKTDWAWDEKERMLSGAQVILVPQSLSSSDQEIDVEIDGRLYYTQLPSEVLLEEGKVCEINILFQSTQEHLISVMQGNIADWKGTSHTSVESKNMNGYINIESLSFLESNVYEVIHKGRAIAQICKEYLLADEIEAQAIVAYPVDASGQVVLSDGLVLKVIDNATETNGGKVSWDKSSNKLSYTPGDKPVIKHLSFDPQQKMVCSDTKNGLSVLVRCKSFKDNRNGKIRNYPLVKMATQYWLRENLSASTDLNGTEIPLLKNVSEGVLGYSLYNLAPFYYYSSAMINTGKLIPYGLAIPSREDWAVLKTYLKNNADLIKAAKWNSEDGTVISMANKSYFSAYAVGYFTGESSPIGLCETAAYWLMDRDTHMLSSKTIEIKTGKTEFIEGEVSKNKAFAIRCICK